MTKTQPVTLVKFVPLPSDEQNRTGLVRAGEALITRLQTVGKRVMKREYDPYSDPITSVPSSSRFHLQILCGIICLKSFPPSVFLCNQSSSVGLPVQLFYFLR